ncbi:hypothetical protein GBO34_00825 [Roseivirga pacifica]|uniref:hypothetical protein n=1 Tax=Roseivirga pacifica TaxID=1267423 RepID=UPI002095DB04|nr:hypothetical protein [Roseivirga pacifica]MCO6367856.1 hypothetical protein [Roseivirga pacifica]MCO6377228.1 hypothetical protein [Roseivirga pacifica]
MSTFQISDLFHTSWDSLTPKKCWRIIFGMRVYAAIHQTDKKRLDSELATAADFMLEALKAAALPGKWKLINKQTTNEQKIDIYHDLFFHKEEYPFRHFPIANFSSLRNGLRLTAPEEAMSNCTYGQFKYADNEFSKMVMAKEQGDEQAAEEQINRLVASVYLPKSGKFQKNATDQLADKIGRVAFPWQKELVVEAYANTRQGIIARCPTFWPQPEESAEPTAAQATGPQWHELHFNIAESEVFKGFTTVDQANMYDVFDYLEALAKRKTTKTQ